MNTKNRRATAMLALLSIVLLILTLMSAVGCKGGSQTTSTSPTAAGVGYAENIQPIFNSSCVVCHAGAGQAGLALEPGVSYGKLVGVPSTESTSELRVKAGSPDQSYLIAKIKGTQVAAGGGGAQMPLNAPPLSQQVIDLIQQWIYAGAPNN
jgi:hypothetical protein